MSAQGTREEERTRADVTACLWCWPRAGRHEEDCEVVWECCDAEPPHDDWNRCIKTEGHAGDHMTDKDHAAKTGYWPRVPVGEGEQ